MVDIIRLNSDPHAQAQRLLPWYANGTLEGEDLTSTEAHLAECAECREDLEAEKIMARQIKSLPSDVDRGWAALSARVQATAGNHGRAPERSILGRRIPLEWAIAASLALFIPLLAFSLSRPAPLYRTLGSAPAAESGNLVVIFRPDASEQTMRTILMQNGARIVDGPTSTDAYVLHVPAAARTTAVARLRADRHISLAEPIDGDARR